MCLSGPRRFAILHHIGQRAPCIRTHGLESDLSPSLRYPPQDIPQAARALVVRLWARGDAFVPPAVLSKQGPRPSARTDKTARQGAAPGVPARRGPILWPSTGALTTCTVAHEVGSRCVPSSVYAIVLGKRTFFAVTGHDGHGLRAPSQTRRRLLNNCLFRRPHHAAGRISCP